MGMGGGFGVSIGLAILLDKFDRRVRYPEQVTRGMGLTILGTLPRLKSSPSGMRGDDAVQMVEALRTIRLNLVHAYGSAGPIVITVTSPGSGDGKSFVASNLALTFADAGQKTLLIDGDIRRGALHRVLNVNRKPGLIDYLCGQATKEQIVQQTRVPMVDFIGCGTRKLGGPELLASQAMSQLLIALRGNYSVIILDCAPLGAGVDPLVLGSLTGNLLLVLRTGVTDREYAQAKMENIERLPIRVLGAVLNDVRAEGLYRYYSYLPGYASENEAEEPALVGASKQLTPG
jgi:capsular exopolysaccharide synthesis family protein